MHAHLKLLADPPKLPATADLGVSTSFKAADPAASHAGFHSVLPQSWRRDTKWQLLMAPKGTRDDPTKILLSDAQGQPRGVLLWSTADAPRLVGEGIERALAARRAIPPELGAAVLEPLECGVLHGRSFALLPYRHPWAKNGWRRRAARLWFGAPVLDWLASATAESLTATDTALFEQLFARPLVSMIADEDMPATLRQAAAAAIEDIAKGNWHPQAVLMHGDFWEGNLLHADADLEGGGIRLRERFVVIDWPTSRVQGHAVYDLLRMCLSLRVPRGQLQRELHRHAIILDCRPQDLRSYLLAHAGWLGQRLGCYSRERFLTATVNLDQALQQALGKA